MGISAKIIKHSKVGEEELITIELELHRFILPEFNTHRSVSRNFESSRAVPIEKKIEQVRTNPAMPTHWGKNQRGMVAEQECTNPIKIDDYDYFDNPADVELYEMTTLELSPEGAWLYAAQQASSMAEAMYKAGYHKQVVNRLLEPFMWTKGVATATREAWKAMLALRLHKDAQPEFQALAKEIDRAIFNSHPVELDVGHFHLPYVDSVICQDTGNQYFYDTDGSELSLEDAIKVSVSCCAQVSYRNLDTSLEKAHKIYNMLNLPVNGQYPDDPAHFSPAEHVARVEDWRDWYNHTAGGNFVTMCFWQYRKALEQGQEAIFCEMSS